MRKWTCILLLVSIAVALAILYAFNPEETTFMPRCTFRMLTGWSCPGCGLLRFVHAALHGRFLEAIAYNYMLLLLLPYVLLLAIERLVLTGQTQKRWQNIIEGRVLTMALCLLAPLWFVLRNMLNI